MPTESWQESLSKLYSLFPPWLIPNYHLKVTQWELEPKVLSGHLFMLPMNKNKVLPKIFIIKETITNFLLFLLKLCLHMCLHVCVYACVCVYRSTHSCTWTENRERPSVSCSASLHLETGLSLSMKPGCQPAHPASHCPVSPSFNNRGLWVCGHTAMTRISHRG